MVAIPPIVAVARKGAVVASAVVAAIRCIVAEDLDFAVVAFVGFGALARAVDAIAIRAWGIVAYKKGERVARGGDEQGG